MIFEYVLPHKGSFFVEAESQEAADAEAAVTRANLAADEQAELRAAVQIMKTDVPAAWKTSADPQRRIAWAVKRLFVEARRELVD